MSRDQPKETPGNQWKHPHDRYLAAFLDERLQPNLCIRPLPGRIAGGGRWASPYKCRFPRTDLAEISEARLAFPIAFSRKSRPSQDIMNSPEQSLFDLLHSYETGKLNCEMVVSTEGNDTLVLSVGGRHSSRSGCAESNTRT